MTGTVICKLVTKVDVRVIDVIVAADALQNILSADYVVNVEGLDEWFEAMGKNRESARLSSISIIQQREEKSGE